MNAGRYGPSGRAAGNRRSFWPKLVCIGEGVPNSAIDEVGTVIDELFSLCILHTDLHKLLEGRVIAVVPVLEFVEVRLDGPRDSLDGHSMLD